MNNQQLVLNRRIPLECPFDFQPLVPFKLPGTNNDSTIHKSDLAAKCLCINMSPNFVLRCTKCAYMITTLPPTWQEIGDTFNYEQLQQGYHVALNRQNILRGKTPRSQFKKLNIYEQYQRAVAELQVWQAALTRLHQLQNKQVVNGQLEQRRAKGSYFVEFID